MTREETINILMSVQAAYPNYRPPDKTVTVNVWCEMLREYTYPQISEALKAYMLSDTSGFAPSIGQIVEKVHAIQEPEGLTEMEAWSLVSRALRNGCYHAEEEYAGLPPEVQRAVGSPSQLRNWAMTDVESVENVIQSNFMRTYRAVLHREREISRMSSEIRNRIPHNPLRRIVSKEKEDREERPAEWQERKGVPMPDGYMDRLRKTILSN